MKCKKYSQVGPLAQSLIGHIKEFITEYVLAEGSSSSQIRQNQRKDVSAEKTLIADEGAKEVKAENTLIADEGVKETKEEQEVDQVLATCERLRDLASQKPVMDHEAVDGERIALAKQFREVVDSILLTHVRVSR